MSRKNRGFPLEYYPGEILTEREAGINRKMLSQIAVLDTSTFKSLINSYS